MTAQPAVAGPAVRADGSAWAQHGEKGVAKHTARLTGHTGAVGAQHTLQQGAGALAQTAGSEKTVGKEGACVCVCVSVCDCVPVLHMCGAGGM